VSAADLIRRCHAAGVRLVADGQYLRVRGGARKQFIAELRERKNQVLEHLRRIASGDVELTREPDPIAADPAEFVNWSCTPEPDLSPEWKDESQEHAAWWERRTSIRRAP
jgi:hypothetical protein